MVLSRSMLMAMKHPFFVVREGRAGYLTTSTNEPFDLDENDIGKLYTVPKEQIPSLNFSFNLPFSFYRQVGSLRECTWLFREQTHEAFSCLREVEGDNRPALRLVLWGKFGTGKTLTLNQLRHLAQTRNFVTLTARDAMEWARDNYRPINMSTYKSGRVDSPWWAVRLLSFFKVENSFLWERFAALKTTKHYQWAKAESTPEGKPLTDIVEMGLSAPFLSTDCLGALCRELRTHASAGRIKLLVLIDKANSLYGRTVVKKANRTIASSDELSLNIFFRKFLLPIWSNGLCALVADRAVISDSRDSLSIAPTDPRTLFGDTACDQIEPYMSVGTKLYTEEEFDALHNYYLEKNWIAQQEGPEGEARRQIMFLSALSPYYYERLCSTTWKLGTCVPILNSNR